MAYVKVLSTVNFHLTLDRHYKHIYFGLIIFITGGYAIDKILLN